MLAEKKGPMARLPLLLIPALLLGIWLSTSGVFTAQAGSKAQTGGVNSSSLLGTPPPTDTPTQPPGPCVPTPTWGIGQSLNPARYEIQGALVSDNNPRPTPVYSFYALGGLTSPGVPSSQVNRYDPVLNSWVQTAPLSSPAARMAVGSADWHLYAAGGYIGGSGPGSITSTLRIYSAVGNSWSFGASMPMPVESAASVVLDGVLYVIGGDDSTATLTSNYAYSISSNSWVARTPLPGARKNASAIAANGRILVIGGLDAIGHTNNVILAYDPALNTWSNGGPVDLGGRGNEGGVVPYGAGGYLFLDGGDANGQPSNTTHISDPVRGWVPGPTLNVSRMGMALGVLTDGRVITYGGLTGDGTSATNSAELLAPMPPCPTSTLTITDTPTNTSTYTPTITGVTPTPTPDCSSVDVHPTWILPPGAFIYVTVPAGWTWSWVPYTPFMQYGCTPDYPNGVSCGWSCDYFQPQFGYAAIFIYDQTGVQRCDVAIYGSRPVCPTPIPMPTYTPVLTDTPTPVPTCSAVPTFTDVHPNDWFTEYVICLYCRGAISGYNDGTFRPGNNVTRGQISKVVVLALAWQLDCPGIGHFTDVPPSSTFYCYIETASGHGIISGYSDGTFRPGNNVTRGQICKMVVLAMAWPLIDPLTPTFSDVPRGSPFYTYIETAVCHQIISGYSDGTFRPGNPATRAQVAKIICLAVRNEHPCDLTPTPPAMPRP